MRATLKTARDLELAVRRLCPDSLADVDKRHVEYWGSLDPEYAYSWFESLAYGLNAQMGSASAQLRFDKIVSFMEEALRAASAEVANCMDVAFVENLFWKVPPSKAERSWQRLPDSLKTLYIAFHGSPPV